MKLATLALLVPLVAPALVQAMPCYTLVGPRNDILYQATEPPLNLSYRIGDELARRYPGDHLVMGESRLCPQVAFAGASVRNVAFGKADASRGARSRRTGRPDRS